MASWIFFPKSWSEFRISIRYNRRWNSIKASRSPSCIDLSTSLMDNPSKLGWNGWTFSVNPLSPKQYDASLWLRVLLQNILTLSHFHSGIVKYYNNLKGTWYFVFTYWQIKYLLMYSTMILFIPGHQYMSFNS